MTATHTQHVQEHLVPRSSSDCETELLRQLRAGDEQAYDRFVRQNTGRMFAVARRYLRCEEDAADAVQDAFASAFRALGSFSGNSSLATWLHRIVVNTCLMKLRSQSRRPTVSIEELLPTFDETGHHMLGVTPWSEDAPRQAERAETQAQVRACIDQLPDPYRTVLFLRDLEEMDTDETARMLGIAPGAVKTRLHRARQALRTLLEPLFSDASEKRPAKNASPKRR